MSIVFLLPYLWIIMSNYSCKSVSAPVKILYLFDVFHIKMFVPVFLSSLNVLFLYTVPKSLEYRSGNEDCVTRRVRYSCTVIGR